MISNKELNALTKAARLDASANAALTAILTRYAVVPVKIKNKITWRLYMNGEGCVFNLKTQKKEAAASAFLTFEEVGRFAYNVASGMETARQSGVKSRNKK